MPDVSVSSFTISEGSVCGREEGDVLRWCLGRRSWFFEGLRCEDWMRLMITEGRLRIGMKEMIRIWLELDNKSLP